MFSDEHPFSVLGFLFFRASDAFRFFSFRFRAESIFSRFNRRNHVENVAWQIALRTL